MDRLSEFDISALALIAQYPDLDLAEVRDLMTEITPRAQRVAREIVVLARRDHGVRGMEIPQAQPEGEQDTAKAFLDWAEANGASCRGDKAASRTRLAGASI